LQLELAAAAVVDGGAPEFVTIATGVSRDYIDAATSVSLTR